MTYSQMFKCLGVRMRCSTTIKMCALCYIVMYDDVLHVFSRICGCVDNKFLLHAISSTFLDKKHHFRIINRGGCFGWWVLYCMRHGLVCVHATNSIASIALYDFICNLSRVCCEIHIWRQLNMIRIRF